MVLDMTAQLAPMMWGMFALMLWPQPDDLGSRLVQAVARRRRGSHEEVLGLIDELVEIGAQPPTRPPAQPRQAPSAPAVTSATIAPITAPASTSPG